MNQTSLERQKSAMESASREKDFMAALKAKDSQIAVLRVNFEKTESLVQGLEERLDAAEKQLSV